MFNGLGQPTTLTFYPLTRRAFRRRIIRPKRGRLRLHGDRALDLVIASCNIPKPCHVPVLPGNGDGSFRAPVHFHVGVNPVQVVVADFTHDGKPDIATINGGDSTISILLNTTQFPLPR